MCPSWITIGCLKLQYSTKHILTRNKKGFDQPDFCLSRIRFTEDISFMRRSTLWVWDCSLVDQRWRSQSIPSSDVASFRLGEWTSAKIWMNREHRLFKHFSQIEDFNFRWASRFVNVIQCRNRWIRKSQRRHWSRLTRRKRIAVPREPKHHQTRCFLCEKH